MRARLLLLPFVALLLAPAHVSCGDAPAPAKSDAPAEVAKPPVIEGEPSAPYMAELKARNIPRGTGIKWDVFPEGVASVRPVKTEQAILVAGPAGTYRVKCLLVRLNGDAVEIDELVKEVTLTHKPPVPIPPGPNPPGPNPPGPNPPGPNPPAPDGTLGLAKASRDGLAQVTDQDKRAELTKQQRAHASAVAAGAFTGPPSILAGWRAANNRVEPDLTKLAAWQAKWKPWAVAVSAKLAELHGAGKLPDNAAWVQAFNEIADGLEK